MSSLIGSRWTGWLLSFLMPFLLVPQSRRGSLTSFAEASVYPGFIIITTSFFFLFFSVRRLCLVRFFFWFSWRGRGYLGFVIISTSFFFYFTRFIYVWYGSSFDSHGEEGVTQHS